MRINKFTLGCWFFLIANFVWWGLCVTGLYLLGKAVIEWLNRN